LRAADRVALVIGNSRYDHLGDRLQLASPANDAADVAGKLKAMGYTLATGRAVIDATRKEMIDAIDAFAKQARNSEANS
jgi:uncharacterized caspase-like protein